jgi:single-strand DNA-binding protein
MTDTITVTGIVATAPRHVVTSEGLPITNFRLASTQRKFDRKENKWVDSDTNWYTISSFRQLAANAAACVVKGQRVIVTGRLRIREWAKDERNGLSIDIEADAIGHDLTWGTSTYARTITSTADDDAAIAEPGTSTEQSSESSVVSQDSAPVPF